LLDFCRSYRTERADADADADAHSSSTMMFILKF
jgi:hypothetical protein